MCGDPEQEYFADGMVEEIITALSRIRWLFVIARNSSFTYKGRAVNVKQVGKDLGVMYVLEGSVRKAGNRIRITAQLLDATNGAHLWADRFDAKLDDVFELQDNVASSVAGVIEPTLLLLWLQEHPNWAPCLRFLASCYAHLGRLGDAQSIVLKLRSITPDLIPSAEHWRIREDREYYLNGLRLAVGVAPEKSPAVDDVHCTIGS
jgi:TolB-like protein